MTDQIKKLFNERLGRYQAAIALEPTDRIPISTTLTAFLAKNSGYTHQQIMYYDPQLLIQAGIDFVKENPELDTLQPLFQWAPSWEVVNRRYYRIPGRDISPNSLHQFVEAEYMKENEYRMLIDDPVGYRINYYFPRVFGEFKERGSIRSYMAFLKAGLVSGVFKAMSREGSERLAREAGMPAAFRGMFVAPFDYLADFYRGLQGITKDMFRQPDNVIEACEALLPDMVNRALFMADPQKQYPIFNPTHKPCFMSPKQFDTFYWPAYKKGIMMLIEAGYKVRVFLEGDWSPHWHHLIEFPKGTLLCDIDNEADIFKAKEVFGHRQCITGGIPNDMLILGTPEDVRARVKLLCETVGKDGGWLPNGGGHIPQDTKPENFRALVDAVMEYGRYTDGPAPMPKPAPESSGSKVELPEARMVTPWDVIKAENEWAIPGDEELIKKHWELFEKMAYNWLISW